MCLSAEGDLVAGVVVLAIGIDACRHLEGRREYLFVAGLPLLLGVHQIVEAFVWWGLQGHVPERLGEVAMWAYLLVAFVALPALVPALVHRIEPDATRRRWIVPFVVLGTAVGAWLLVAMARTAPTAELGDFHVAYSVGLEHTVVVVGLYVIATCGAMLASTLRPVRWFGVANLVAVVVLARLSADGFASLWCFYAALASAAIAVHLRVTGPAAVDQVPSGDPGGRHGP